MRLNTSILFQLLIKALKPDLVCDVGSLDGDRARRFRRLVPGARIVAFEANPLNARAMQEDRRNHSAKIELRDQAAWHANGTVTFHVEQLPEGAENPAYRGVSSIRMRREEYRLGPGWTAVTVPSVRLDSFVLAEAPEVKSIALWIDVEGTGFEALSGIERIKERVQAVHVEVEEHEFWHGQRLAPDVHDLMRRLGFEELARGRTGGQHDVVFVRSSTYHAAPVLGRTLVLSAFLLSLVLRRRLGTKVAKVLDRVLLPPVGDRP